MISLLATVLTWTAPTLSAGSVAVPAGCAECAVLHVPRKTGERWWEQPTVTDTLATYPASDGLAMGCLVPLWVGYGACNVVCRDAAGNWSGPSNYVASRLSE